MPSSELSCNTIRIINFDDSIFQQQKLLQDFSFPPFCTKIIDCRSQASCLRYWASPNALKEFQRRLSPQERNLITLYGSGDFHHISSVLLEQFTEPVSLIVFDYHPDLYGLASRISCGSWVPVVAARKNVKKVILLGPSSNDLSSAGLLSTSLRGLRNHKVEIFPYCHQPTKVFLRSIDSTDCFKVTREYFYSTICWQNLADKNILTFLEELITRIPTEAVYVSIDKDCLLGTHAISNWEEGLMPLEWLLTALAVLKSKKNIVGMDITGEYSPFHLKSLAKRIISFIDHPRKTFTLQEYTRIDTVNEATNLKILQLFLSR